MTDIVTYIVGGHTEEVLRLLLKTKGKTQNEAAAEIGVSVSHVFYLALIHERNDILQVLLDPDQYWYINVNLRYRRCWRTPLYIAIDTENAEAVRMLLAHPDIEHDQEMGRGGATPLFNACFSGNSAVIRAFLESGKQFNFRKKRENPLHRCYGEDARITAFVALRKGGASKEIQDAVQRHTFVQNECRKKKK